MTIRACTFAEYAQLDAVNFSTLRAIAKSPKAYAYLRAQQGARPDADTYRLGRASHTAVLEPRRFLREYTLWDKMTIKGDKIAPRRGKAWEAFSEQSAGKTVLTVAQYELAQDLSVVVRDDPVASRYLSADGQAEATLVWTDERYGLECKARVDWLCSPVPGEPGAICDLKFVNDIEPDMFGRAMARHRSHVQAAWYQEAVFRVTGERQPYKLIAVQTRNEPDVAVYDVPNDALELGREEYETWLQRLDRARQTRHYHGVGGGYELTLQLPRWAWGADDNEDTSGIGLIG